MLYKNYTLGWIFVILVHQHPLHKTAVNKQLFATARTIQNLYTRLELSLFFVLWFLSSLCFIWKGSRYIDPRMTCLMLEVNWLNDVAALSIYRLHSCKSDDQLTVFSAEFVNAGLVLTAMTFVVNYTDTENISDSLLFVGTLEWSFIIKTIKHYNFGPSIMAWLKTFYSYISSTENRGWSTFFLPSRDVRQGFPLPQNSSLFSKKKIN